MKNLKLENYKSVLMLENNVKDGGQNSILAYKFLALLDYYERKKHPSAIDTLIFILNAYTEVSEDQTRIKFNLPEETKRKIEKLFVNKIQTFTFGSKSLNNMLDDLINENH